MSENEIRTEILTLAQEWHNTHGVAGLLAIQAWIKIARTGPLLTALQEAFLIEDGPAMMASKPKCLLGENHI